MERLIFGGVVVISLAVFACAAPQLQNGRDGIYKNNTRENPAGEGELFGYPEDPSKIESKQNARNRTPVYIPNRCQKNEILYPGDQEFDWVCDCKPTFIYHPPTRQCYQLFTQGYCKGDTMLTLRKDAKQPECVRNRCHQAGADMVEYEGKCVELNAYNDKCKLQDVKQLIGVREDTNELGCVNISAVNLPGNSTMDNEAQQRGN